MKRLQWADALRGFLILLVVLGHAIQYTPGLDLESNHLWNMIYSFHMPAFIAVSGYLNFRMGGVGCKRKVIHRRFFQLLVPFFCWSMISSFLAFPDILPKLVKTIIFPDTGFWFLYALFCISMIFILADYISEKFCLKQELAEITVSLLLVCIMVFVEFRYFGYQFIAYYFLFYIAGYYYRKYDKYLPKNTCLLIILVIIWTILAWFSNSHSLPFFLRNIPLVPSSVLLYGYRFITAIIACYVLLELSPRLLDGNNRISSRLGALGKVSLGIYVTHFLFCEKLTRYICNSFGEEYISQSIIIAFILSTFIAYGIVYLLSLNKYSAKYLLGK